jgi:SAM-dependent methyltransferase
MGVNMDCIVCSEKSLELIEKFSNFKGVTSDDKPFYENFLIAYCKSCGHVQKLIDKKWKENVSSIYNNYKIYELSGGGENLVFGQNVSPARSQILFENLAAEVVLPQKGDLLDFGCGNGAVLKSFGKHLKGWELFGYDSNARFENEIKNLPDLNSSFLNSISQINHKFDLITANYSLEHATDPVTVFNSLKGLLKEPGVVSIVVPNFKDNPFDLMVVDHCSHFTSDTLGYLADLCGYEIVAVKMDLIPRSIVMILKNSATVDKGVGPLKPVKTDGISNNLSRSAEWLRKVILDVEELSTMSNFGVFGTGTAAGWISGSIDSEIKFFVDEDPSKIGKEYLGCPVISPVDLPDEAIVYIGLPTKLAVKTKTRLEKEFPDKKFFTPPELVIQ